MRWLADSFCADSFFSDSIFFESLLFESLLFEGLLEFFKFVFRGNAAVGQDRSADSDRRAPSET